MGTNHCCFMGLNGDCKKDARYVIWGTKGPEDYTHACDSHVGDLAGPGDRVELIDDLNRSKEMKETIETIHEKLKLQNPWEFQLDRMRHNLSEYRVAQLGRVDACVNVWRGTGRSTRQMLQAVAYASNKRRVILLPHEDLDKHQAVAFFQQTRTFAADVGADPELFLWCEPDKVRDLPVHDRSNATIIILL